MKDKKNKIKDIRIKMRNEKNKMKDKRNKIKGEKMNKGL